MDEKDEAQKALQRVSLRDDVPEVGGVYRHYKGGLYVVVCVSLKEDTLEPMVTYRSNLKGTSWTRTLDDFAACVTPPGGSGPVPRFTREPD